ncbi:MAG: hypothetical protein RLZZ237_4036 [Pseudomonadota bacterium]|jgi:hypothetical protein
MPLNFARAQAKLALETVIAPQHDQRWAIGQFAEIRYRLLLLQHGSNSLFYVLTTLSRQQLAVE